MEVLLTSATTAVDLCRESPNAILVRNFFSGVELDH